MAASGDTHDRGERRRYPRVKVKIPIEMQSGTGPSWRTATDEVSLGGCYVETMFTLEVGAKLSLTLWLDQQEIHTTAVVVTQYPQVGNGFDFIDMTSEDRLKLNEFILAWEQERSDAP